MKIVKVKPLEIIRVAEGAHDSLDMNSQSEKDPEKLMKHAINNIKRTGNSSYLAIIPETNEAFTFIPVVEDNRFYVTKFPNPVQLYFSLAFANYQFSVKARNNIVSQKEEGVYLHFVNEYLYNWNLQYRISTIIFLHSTVEAFVNYQMPDEYVYKQVVEGKEKGQFIKVVKEYSKEQTERYIDFKEKVSKVIPEVSQVDFYKDHKPIYDRIMNLNKLRNDIIHLRSAKSGNQSQFNKAFSNVMNANLEDYVEAVKSFINIIEPDFIEFDEVSGDNKRTLTIKLPHYKSCGLSIDMFIKMLETPAEKVIYNLPKSEDKDFYSFKTWFLQSLNSMAKSQLIYLPDIKDMGEEIHVEVVKTEKGMRVSQPV
ncbi:hypothetical protein Oweho_1310 [Owenweeksia hongkongensis DSM 17368]|uniref:Uncharacterized protein n=1 Tax=Owenweeksia hongkongensis (strain DSM 17368 / CIP 108786 / JCM 12287 / NRRL B-23963 / UST20020801) TaxID=926562 RepID=G8R6X4_OWEHD|nr:hypothetical protein [Owenweeksia hongkongensis]AEV32309.1 hypothetical protein Oweho_1310 [Owenweeksia hongkongensis DSM 17368]